MLRRLAVSLLLATAAADVVPDGLKKQIKQLKAKEAAARAAHAAEAAHAGVAGVLGAVAVFVALPSRDEEKIG